MRTRYLYIASQTICAVTLGGMMEEVAWGKNQLA